MTQTAEEVRVGADGQIYVADAGTAAPASVLTALDPAFSTALGFVSEDGATLSDGKEITNIGAWQSFYPVRVLTTARTFTAAFALRQWNRDTIALAFGGGTFTDLGGGVTEYDPPDPSTVDLRIAVLDWQDGTINYRLVIPRCIVSETVETNLSRTAASDLPITLSVLAPAEGDQPWYYLTDDPNIAS